MHSIYHFDIKNLFIKSKSKIFIFDCSAKKYLIKIQ